MNGQPIDFWSIFRPLRKQLVFLKKSLEHRFMLFGGARGGGKSMVLRWGLLWRLLMWAMQGHKGVRVGLFSEDYPTLKDRQISKIQKEFPGWLGRMKKTQAEGLGFFLKPEFGGGAILLRNLDDPEKYQSAEFAGVAIEELTKNELDVFDVLRGSLRWPGISNTFFWGATNPGGPGHLWVRALWVDRDYSGDYERYADLAHEFCFVRSLPTDNPFLDETYWADLNSLAEDRRKAWVEGDWDSFVGQAFKEWHRDVHVTSFRPEAREYRDRFRWTCSGDWGTKFGCLYLMATGPDRSIVRWEWTFGDMDPKSAGYQYGKMLLRWPKPEWVALDEPPVPDMGPTINERFQAGLTAALGDKAPPVISPPRGPGSRLTKKQLMHEALRFPRTPEGKIPRTEDGTVAPWALPSIQIHTDCKYLIRTLPALPLDKKNSEDVDTDADDHGYDAVANWFMARTPQVDREKTKRKHPDDHPGWDLEQGVRADEAVPDWEDEPRWSRIPEELR